MSTAVHLETISESGAPPRSVIKDGQSAHAIKRHLIRGDIGRSAQRAVLKANYDGHPPHDPKELAKRGLGEMSNVNMKRMAAQVNSQVDSDLDAQFEVSPLATVVTDFGTGNKGHEFSEGLTEEYNRTLDRWPGYYDVRAKSNFNRNFYGYGPTYFEDEYNWRVIAADTGQIYVDRDADTDLSKNDVLQIRRTWRLHELYRKIEDEKTASRLGWTVKAVRKAIIWAASQNQNQEQYSTRLWETWNDRIKGNDLYWGRISPGITLYDLLSIEYDSTVSRRLLTENDTEDILFTRYKAAKDFRAIICPFFLSKQESLIHSIRGLGAQIFSVLKMLDKIDNRIFDMTLIGGSIVIQPKTSGARDKLNALNLGPVTVIPAETNFIPMNFPNLSQGGIVTHNMLMQTISQTSGEYQSSAQATQSGEAPTATQNNNDLQMLARRSSSQRNQLFNELDNEHWQMFKRLANPNLPDECTPRGKTEWCLEAREFQKRCLERGIPLSAMQEPYLQSVKATRPIGSGSPMARSQQSDRLLSRLPLVQNQQSRDLIIKDSFTADFGPELARRYFPAVPGKLLVATAKTAQLENAAMQDGHSVDVMDYEDAVIHLGIHLPLLQQTVQSLQQSSSAQGQPPNMQAVAKVYGLLTVALPHCSAHLQRIAGDPTMKDGVAQAVNTMKQLDSAAQHLQFQLKAMASAQQRAALAQSQQQTADAAKMQLDAGKLALATRKQGHKEATDSVNLAIKLREHGQNFNLNALDAQLKIMAATQQPQPAQPAAQPTAQPEPANATS